MKKVLFVLFLVLPSYMGQAHSFALIFGYAHLGLVFELPACQ